MSAATAIVGSEFWTVNILESLPPAVAHGFIASIGIQTLCAYHVVLALTISINLVATTGVLWRAATHLHGWKRVQALLQASSFCGFLYLEWLFYHAVVMTHKDRNSVVPLMVGYVTIVSAYGVICIPMLLSFTSMREYHTLQWPAIPFYTAAILFYRPPPALQTWIQAYKDLLVLAVATWHAVYVVDLLTATIKDLSRYLGVYCFSVRPRYPEYKTSTVAA